MLEAISFKHIYKTIDGHIYKILGSQYNLWHLNYTTKITSRNNIWQNLIRWIKDFIKFVICYKLDLQALNKSNKDVIAIQDYLSKI